MRSICTAIMILASMAISLKILCQTENCAITFNCTDNSKLAYEISVSECDSTCLNRKVRAFMNSLFSQGYLESEITEKISKDCAHTITFTASKQYSWNQISYLGETLRIESKDEIEEFINTKLSHLENSGFPFCQIKTKLKPDSNSINGEIYIEKGQLFLFDSLHIMNSTNHSLAMVSNFLEIKKGNPYSEKLVAEISEKIAELPYLKLTSAPSVIFQNGVAKVFINLKKVNAKSFNGIVGVQPNADQSTSLTGEINLNLVDAFNRGELIKLNWQRINPGAQEIFIQSEIPYLFRSRLGVAGSAQIYRRDSLVNRLITEFNLLYNFNPKLQVSLGVISQNNNTNTSDNSDFQNTTVTGYKIKVEHQSLDNSINPRKGIYFSGAGSVGNRFIDSEKKQLVLGRVNASFFQPIKTRSTAHLFVKSHANFSRNLFKNELEQIGGLSTIRGVDHRSILVSKWLTAGLEYRFLFEENSNFIIFTEQNFYESNNESSRESNGILGVGLGLNIGTRSGIFNFFYSLAKNQNSEFKLNQGKINFGFVSEF